MPTRKQELIERVFSDRCPSFTLKGIVAGLRPHFPGITDGKVHRAIATLLDDPAHRALVAPLPGSGRAYRYRPAAARLIAHLLTEHLTADESAPALSAADSAGLQMMLVAKDHQILELTQQVVLTREANAELREKITLLEANIERQMLRLMANDSILEAA